MCAIKNTVDGNAAQKENLLGDLGLFYFHQTQVCAICNLQLDGKLHRIKNRAQCSQSYSLTQKSATRLETRQTTKATNKRIKKQSEALESNCRKPYKQRIVILE